jgi:hypothetical protein
MRNSTAEAIPKNLAVVFLSLPQDAAAIACQPVFSNQIVVAMTNGQRTSSSFLLKAEHLPSTFRGQCFPRQLQHFPIPTTIPRFSDIKIVFLFKKLAIS